MVLSVLNIWSAKSSVPTADLKDRSAQVNVSVKPANDDKVDVGPMDSVDASGSSSPIGAQEPGLASSTMSPPPEPPSDSSSPEVKREVLQVKPEDNSAPRPAVQPRFSFRSLGFFQGGPNSKPEKITKEQDVRERQKAKTAAKRVTLSLSVPTAALFSSNRSTDRRVEKEALAVQRLIIGPTAITPASTMSRPTSAPVPRAQLTRIKSQLMKPQSANRLIAKLRELPAPESSTSNIGTKSKESASITASATSGKTKTGNSNITIPHPIHAVCLESSESEIQSQHFSKLSPEQSIVSASLDALSSLFSEMHIVDLLTAPGLGLGQPADGKGLLAGAVPTAETVLEGAAKLTPQLMALGYATGKAVLPDHSGIYPPTDRLSVLTYWWGLELCLPPPTLVHLSQAPNVTHQVINFLAALAVMNNGVREILPFLRYMGQFVDFEWSSIEKCDNGKGVVCAATWIMPAAMVPRPWDFPDPPDGAPAQSAPDAAAPASGSESQSLNGPPPTLVVTPPSVIKSNPAQAPAQVQAEASKS